MQSVQHAIDNTSSAIEKDQDINWNHMMNLIHMKKQSIDLNNKTILVTGSPGFIGANLVIRLLQSLTSGTVISLDNMNDYYDPMLKEYRLGLIEETAKSSSINHIFIRGSIADKELVLPVSN